MTCYNFCSVPTAIVYVFHLMRWLSVRLERHAGEQLDNMAQGAQRKVAALALANLVATSRSTVLSHLDDFVIAWTSVMADTEESESGEFVSVLFV
jgi:hypothetical protein